MSERLREGIALFNAGRYFEAHERFEDLWREAAGGARTYLQGLVQAAVGLHHLSAGNQRGGRRVLERGIEKLDVPDGEPSGIDNARLVADLRSVLEGGGVTAVRIRGRTDPSPRPGPPPAGDGPGDAVS